MGMKKQSELNIVLFIQNLRGNLRRLTIVSGVFFLLGILIAVTWEVQYSTSIKLLPESEDEGIGSNLLERFGGLAGLSSFDVSQGSMSPDLYLDIVRSRSFLYELMYEPIMYSQDSTYTYFEYSQLKNPSVADVLEDYTIGLIGKVKNLIIAPKESKTLIEDNKYQVTKDELLVMESLSDRIELELDNVKGTVLIQGKLNSPIAAADFVSKTYEKLAKYTSDYKLSKLNKTIDYLEVQLDSSNQNFTRAQVSLSRFYQANQNITSPYLEFRKQNLEFEYQASRELYQSISTQLQQMKLERQKKTPDFTVLNPILVPVKKSEPRRLLTIILVTGIGVILYMTYLYAKVTIRNFYNHYKETFK